MKKLFIIITAAAVVSFAAPNDKPTKDMARVQQASGLYIFIESAPVGEYEVLGSVKKGGIVWNGKAKEMVDILVRRAKKDYPTADGIIFDDLSLDHATVIKFK